jgi:hypothetical protein
MIITCQGPTPPPAAPTPCPLAATTPLGLHAHYDWRPAGDGYACPACERAREVAMREAATG